MRRSLASNRGWIASTLLLGIIVAIGAALAAWKYSALEKSAAEAANQPEPTEVVTTAVAAERQHRPTMTSIGTVLALRSVTLQNELAGTVREVRLIPGQIVDRGTLLVALDVSVEEAELEAQKAQATLAKTTLDRLEALKQHQATSQEEVDQARAEREIALAQMARTRAIIARKMIRAPFRARVGLSDVHPGQYLNEGTQLTTLQGVAEAAHVDFTVPQRVAAGLHPGDTIGVLSTSEGSPLPARVVALDARVDTTTRNAVVRATLVGRDAALTPGASVRVVVPMGQSATVVAVPVNALRKGPGGDHVFVISPDKQGKTRAHLRQVQSGPVLKDEILILEGLKPGEQVATSGSFKLREAVLVAVAPDSAAAGDSAAGAKGTN
ncbi:MAG: efflux RND transporter periplasmic adaptor subunit [Gemmatimonadales bacterium]